MEEHSPTILIKNIRRFHIIVKNTIFIAKNRERERERERQRQRQRQRERDRERQTDRDRERVIISHVIFNTNIVTFYRSIFQSK